jgi:hypothetical protein
MVGMAQGRLCPPYPALSAVEFLTPLFHEVTEIARKSQENPFEKTPQGVVK